MATRIKSAQAQAAELPGQRPLASQALDIAVERIKQNSTAIAQEFSKADTAGKSAGYQEFLAASQSVGFGWAELALWKQAKLGSPHVDPSEERIREVQALLRPETAPTQQELTKLLLQLAVDATTGNDKVLVDTVNSVTQSRPIVEIARARTNSVPKPSDKREPAKAKADLVARHKLAIQNGDKWMADLVKSHIDAIDNTTNLARLGMQRNAVQTDAAKFRGTLFLHLIDPVLQKISKSNIGTDYQDAGNWALAAHKSFGKLDNQDRTPNKLRDMVTEFVTEKLQLRRGLASKVERSDDEIAKSLVATFYRNLKALQMHSLMGEDGAKVMRAWMVKYGNADPSEKDEPEAKTKSGKKAATPKKSDLAAPAKAPRKPRGTAPKAGAVQDQPSADASALVQDMIQDQNEG